MPLRIYIVGVICLSLTSLVRSQTIPSCFTEAVGSNSIDCDNDDLTGLDNSVYDSISGLEAGKIIRIQLTNCVITDLDFLNSDYLNGVEYLYLNSLTGLQNSHLGSLVSPVSHSLRLLEIANNPQLTSIDELIPTGFGNEWVNLKTLRMQNNAINLIDPTLFSEIIGPDEYNFEGNSLSVLDLSSHSAVTSVRKLLFSGNRLTTVLGLHRFKKLEKLDLSNNELTDVSSFVTNVLTSSLLESFDLKNNRLTSFNPQGPVLNNPSSLTIDLQNNRLQTIASLGQSVAKNVKSLYLRGNGDLQIESGSFSNLNNLETLDISDCGIAEVSTHLQNLSKLRILDLHDNHLNELSNVTFSGTTNVEEINLKNNQLQQIDFMSTSSIILEKLKRLNIGGNQLKNLANFVSAPALQELRMDGGADTNEFNQLSSCLSFTELPATLKIVCARGIRAETVNSCEFRSFLGLLRNQNVIYNNNDCCDKPTCNTNVSLSSYPSPITCPSIETLCTISPVEPPGMTTGVVEGGTTVGVTGNTERANFQGLQGTELLVMILGYVLALLLLVLVIIMCLRRYRSYEKWLEDHQQRDLEKLGSMQLQALRRSTDTLDSVDGRLGGASPKIGVNGTLQKYKVYGQKSADTLSMASGYSQYSTANGKSPFMGRRKFKDAVPNEPEELATRYMGPAQGSVRQNSGEDSPTAMSIYSYASHQIERRRPSETEFNSSPPERRRHRSGGAVQRMDSGDLLDLVDEDILPPRIQVVLQRKATERKKMGDVNSPIVRNARPYGTTPYRTRAKSGIVKKRLSPHLSVNKSSRSGSRTPTVVKRALPDIPTFSQGSGGSSLKSSSSVASNASKLSHASMIKNSVSYTASVEKDESEYNETDNFGLG
ncbi:uncharacterized protein [Watersipora subatra]|uniref:uncharacterized protein isoform X2 n=1 Tax=Watersipora subatra TaxID=2589382 RepID=UPI00355C0B73